MYYFLRLICLSSVFWVGKQCYDYFKTVYFYSGPRQKKLYGIGAIYTLVVFLFYLVNFWWCFVLIKNMNTEDEYQTEELDSEEERKLPY